MLIIDSIYESIVQSIKHKNAYVTRRKTKSIKVPQSKRNHSRQ